MESKWTVIHAELEKELGRKINKLLIFKLCFKGVKPNDIKSAIRTISKRTIGEIKELDF